MDNVIDIKRLWLIFKKNMVMMVVCGIALAGIAFGFSKFIIQPEYSSSVALLVNRKPDENTAAQLQNQQADVQMINTYKDIITRPVILNSVVKNLTTTQKQLIKKAQPATYKTLSDGTRIVDKKAKSAEYKIVDSKYDKSEINRSTLSKNISISNQQDSQIFTVNVTLKNSQLARDSANEIAKVFKQKISSIMSVSNVSVVSKATNNKTPVSPNIKLFTLVGLIVGIFVGFVLGLIKELSDRTVKDISYLTDELGLINLGQINFIGKIKSVDKVVNNDSKSNEEFSRSRSKRRI